MTHGHAHHHERRDVLSDLGDLLGISDNKKSTTTSAVEDAVSVVYVTASPTFTGAIGGYVTGSDPASSATSTAADSTTESSTVEPTTTSKHTTTSATSTSSTSSASSTSSTSSESSTTSSSTTSSSNSSTTSNQSTSTLSTATSTTASSTTSALDQVSSSTASASSTAAASSSTGLTGGAKAGIAIGVILGVGLIAGLVLFWLHRQRKNRQQAEAAVAAENEKFNAPRPAPSPPVPSAPAQSMAMAAYPSNPSRRSAAPRVSLRPITQFNPLFNQPAEGHPYAAGAAVGAVAATAAAGLSHIDEASERPYGGSAHVPPQADPRQDPFTDPANPFDSGSHEGSPPQPISKDAPSDLSQVRDLTPSPTGSISDIPTAAVVPEPSAEPIEAAAAGGVAATAIGAAAAGAASKSEDKPTEARTQSPEYVESPGSRPQSPVVGGAPAASNVHRVQMDFVPSLADEMELRAGQLVRLLKTYDDGWTQCSSMDGSIKGIAPRTCLSARPLQPRRPPGPGPRGPPVMGPNGRPMSPAGGRMGPPPAQRGGPPRFYSDGRPMTPTHSGVPQFPPPPSSPRSMSPGPNRASADVPRPLTPGGSRPASPAGGRSRSNSTSVGQMGGRPFIHRGQSPLAPPTGPLPGPPVTAPALAPAPAPVSSGPPPPPQLQVNGRPQSPVERKSVGGQE